MYIIYSFKTLKLIVFILGCSYFIGIFWYIMCDLYNRYEFEYYEKGVPAFFQGTDSEHIGHYSINGTQIRCANIPFPTEFKDGIDL